MGQRLWSLKSEIHHVRQQKSLLYSFYQIGYFASILSNRLLRTRNATSVGVCSVGVCSVGVCVYEASFLRLKSRSLISFLRSLLLHFIAERPMRLRGELEIGLHSIWSVTSAAARHSGIAIRRCLHPHARTHPPTHKHCTRIQRYKRKQERKTTTPPQWQLSTHR